MSLTSEQKDKRIRLFWYLGLLALPLLVLALLLNQDPYHRVQFNQVLELRAELAERGVGADVIAQLDRVGGRNISAAELDNLLEADSQTLFFMLNSAQLSSQLKGSMQVILKDGFVTRQEARQYGVVAKAVLTDPALYQRLGYAPE
ncbi:hypothetical protein [Motiliproteus sediminis]|uniref:hypothetical protein n=1 Tax=Motiliproteus sediminis TaxID=1468178 RepID=UPI001AF000CD|nr:hypothetical protein [Motiliproteus sediminis]